MPSSAPRVCGHCGGVHRHGERCRIVVERDRERQARHDARRLPARQRGYDSRWDKARATFLDRRPRCEMVAADGHPCGQPATLVDHIEPHRGDQALFWNSANWMPLCVTCHSSRKQSAERGMSKAAQARAIPFDIRPSRIPVTIVCGPPGAGKSTYVGERAGPRYLVIDLDVIRARLAGTDIHQPAPGFTAAALDERNRLLRGLAEDREHEHCFFILAGADAADREAWARKLGGRILLMDTPLEECERRIRADRRRLGQEDRLIGLARDWWRRQPSAAAVPELTGDPR